MGLISFTQRGDFKKTENFLNASKKLDVKKILERYGSEGVAALSKATPKDSGNTSGSWDYKVDDVDGSYRISFINTNKISSGTPVVILIQYGHGTRNGGYVQGRDFINPAIRPIFDKIAEEAWQEVKKL